LTVYHAGDDEAVFAVSTPVIDFVNIRGVIEHMPRPFEAHSVLLEVDARLGVIPFKLVIPHSIRKLRRNSSNGAVDLAAKEQPGQLGHSTLQH
jgi:hypothetical protein